MGIWLLGNKGFFLVLSFIWWIIFFLIFCNYLMLLKMLSLVWIELFYYIEIIFKSIQWKTLTHHRWSAGRPWRKKKVQVGLEVQVLLLLVTINIVLMNKSDCKWSFFVLGYLNWNGSSFFLMCQFNFVSF